MTVLIKLICYLLNVGDTRSDDRQGGWSGRFQAEIVASEGPDPSRGLPTVQIGERQPERDAFLFAIHPDGGDQRAAAQEHRLPSFHPAQTSRSQCHRLDPHPGRSHGRTLHFLG